jgi:hypothetical protein
MSMMNLSEGHLTSEPLSKAKEEYIEIENIVQHDVVRWLNFKVFLSKRSKNSHNSLKEFSSLSALMIFWQCDLFG